MSKYKDPKKNKQFSKELSMLHDKIAREFSEKQTSQTLLGILYNFSLNKLKNLNRY